MITRHPLDRILALDHLAGRASHRDRAIEIGPLIENRSRKIIWIPWFDQPTLLEVLDQLAISRNRRRHGGHADRQGFQQGDAHPFLIRREREQVGRAKTIVHVARRAGKRNDVAQARLGDDRFQTWTLRSFADDLQNGKRMFVRDDFPGPDQRLQIFFEGEPADENGPRTFAPMVPFAQASTGIGTPLGSETIRFGS